MLETPSAGGYAPGAAQSILDAYNVPYEAAPSEPKLATRDVAAQAREFTVLAGSERAEPK